MKMFKYLTSQQLFEFRQTAIEVLINSLHLLGSSEKTKVSYILFNVLKSHDHKLQETTYNCLKSHGSKLLLQIKMVK